VLAVLAMLARGIALRVAPGGSAPLTPPLRGVARALPGRDRKAGAPIEPESRFSDKAACLTVSRSGLSVTDVTGVQSRVWPLQRRGLAWRACW
jgi:hypothetical protein